MKWSFVLGFLLLGAFFFSCHRSHLNGGQVNKVLRISFSHDPGVLDPRKGSEIIGSTIHFMLFEGLTKFTSKGDHEPGMAESFELSNDGLVYTFFLRKAYWSDGTLVSAFDFEYSWKSMLHPDFRCPNAHLLYPIKNGEKVKRGKLDSDSLGVKALDERTLQVTLEMPTPYFLDLVSFCIFSPVPSHIASKDPKWADSLNPHFVTNGPFTLKEWRLSDQMVFAKNPLFWQRDKVKLDLIKAYVIQDEITALNMYQKNDLDLCGAGLSAIPSEWTSAIDRQGELFYEPVGASTLISFNLKDPIFQNKSIRKAFSLAIDRKMLIDHVTAGSEEVATGCIPSVLKKTHTPLFSKNKDPEAARSFFEQGLTELGLTRDSLGSITYKFFSTITDKKIAQALKEEWRSTLGVDVKLESVEFKILLDELSQRNYQMSEAKWVVQFNDPMGILDRFKYRETSKNYPGWENEQYIELLNRSFWAQSAVERSALLEEAENLLVEETPLSCLYHWNSVYAKKPHLHHFYISPIGSLHFNEADIY